MEFIEQPGGPGVRLRKGRPMTEKDFLAGLAEFALALPGRRDHNDFPHRLSLDPHGATLFADDEQIGISRWRKNGPQFDPPLEKPPADPSLRSLLRAWVDRAQYRKTTGI